MASQLINGRALTVMAGVGLFGVALMSVSSAHAQMAISNDGLVFPDGTEQTSAVIVPTDCPHGDSIVWDSNSDSWICATDLSPDADLTGAIYCLFGQGTWLFADPGVSAGVTANPFIVRVDFTSSTQLTATTISDPITGISISSIAPFFTIGDSVDDLGVEMLTYTVVANLLTITFFEDGEADSSRFIMAADAQVFVGSFGQRGSDGTNQSWETGMMVGVQAANCDGLIG